MPEDWTPLALSMAAAVLGVALGTVRVWRMQRRFAPLHPNAPTARRFAVGFALAAVLWLVYGITTGYSRFLQPEPLAWLLAVHAQALWSVPLFITAIVWAAGVGVGWVMRLLQREGDPATRR